MRSAHWTMGCAVSAMMLLTGCSVSWLGSAPPSVSASAIPTPDTWTTARAHSVLTARMVECRPPERPTIGTLCAATAELVHLRTRNLCAIMLAKGQAPASWCAAEYYSGAP